MTCPRSLDRAPRTAHRARQRGVLLLPVVFALTVIAAVAYIDSRSSAMNASVTATQAQVDQLRYAAEAALAHQAALVTGANCGTLPSIANTPLGATGYTYDAVPGAMNLDSTIGVTATGRYGSLASTLQQTQFAYSSASNVTAWTAAVADAYIDGDYPTNSYGGAQTIWVSRWDNERMLLRFDLSSLPTTAKVVSATLALWQDTPAGAGTISVHKLLRSWVEGNRNGSNGGGGAGASWTLAVATGSSPVSWTTPGSDYDAASAASFTVTATQARFYVDITTLAQDWVATPAANYGMSLIGEDGTVNAGFSSKEDTAGKRPYLQLTYLLPCNDMPRSIGIAQYAAAPVKVADGTYDITYTISLKNLGVVPANNVQVVNNVAATYSSFSLRGLPTASSPLTVNASYTGSGSNTKLLSGSDSLPVGNAVYTIAFTVRVTGIAVPSGPYGNSATATAALTAGGAAIATDTSNSGDDSAIDVSTSSPTYVRFFALKADTSIASASPAINYGGSTALTLSGASGGSRLLAKFDDNPLSSSVVLRAAALRWTVSQVTSPSGASRDVSVYGVTRSWNEGDKTGSGGANGATWNSYDGNSGHTWSNAGGDYATPPVSTTTVPASFASGYLDLDVTSLVQLWIWGWTNNGMLVRTAATDVFRVVADEASAGKPELVVSY